MDVENVPAESSLPVDRGDSFVGVMFGKSLLLQIFSRHFGCAFKCLEVIHDTNARIDFFYYFSPFMREFCSGINSKSASD